MALELNEKNFEEEALKGLALVDFWAPWCGPCQMMGPVIEELASEYKEAKIVKLNIDENGTLAEKYEVLSIPTLLIFKDGKIVKTFNGVTAKEELIKSLDELK
ncbi:MAG: thioredoxin [Patescibacteria group bacterium]